MDEPTSEEETERRNLEAIVEINVKRMLSSEGINNYISTQMPLKDESVTRQDSMDGHGDIALVTKEIPFCYDPFYGDLFIGIAHGNVSLIRTKPFTDETKNQNLHLYFQEGKLSVQQDRSKTTITKVTFNESTTCAVQTLKFAKDVIYASIRAYNEAIRLPNDPSFEPEKHSLYERLKLYISSLFEKD